MHTVRRAGSKVHHGVTTRNRRKQDEGYIHCEEFGPCIGSHQSLQLDAGLGRH